MRIRRGSLPHGRANVAQKLTRRFQADPGERLKISIDWVMLREISCDFVDHVLTIRSHTIHGGVPTRAARVGC